MIGGGLPCAAYGGRADIMNHLAPLGDVYRREPYQKSAAVLGLSMMQLIESFGVYERAEAQTAQLVNGIQSAIDHANAP